MVFLLVNVIVNGKFFKGNFNIVVGIWLLLLVFWVNINKKLLFGRFVVSFLLIFIVRLKLVIVFFVGCFLFKLVNFLVNCMVIGLLVGSFFFSLVRLFVNNILLFNWLVIIVCISIRLLFCCCLLINEVNKCWVFLS